MNSHVLPLAAAAASSLLVVGVYYCLGELKDASASLVLPLQSQVPLPLGSLTRRRPDPSAAPLPNVLVSNWKAHNLATTSPKDYVTFLVKDKQGRCLAKTIFLTPALYFLRESPLVDQAVSTNTWVNPTYSFTTLPEDIDALIDHWFNGTSLAHHPRAAYLFEMLISHSCLPLSGSRLSKLIEAKQYQYLELLLSSDVVFCETLTD